MPRLPVRVHATVLSPVVALSQLSLCSAALSPARLLLPFRAVSGTWLSHVPMSLPGTDLMATATHCPNSQLEGEERLGKLVNCALDRDH